MSEAQQRIIAHMNKDHALALGDYVAVYGNTNKAKNIQLTEFELDYMKLTYTVKKEKKSLKIRFQSPLKSFGEARERLVDMAKTSAATRGYSHVQLLNAPYPTGAFDSTLFGIMCLLCFGITSPSTLKYVYSNFLFMPEATAAGLVEWNTGILAGLLAFNFMQTIFNLVPIITEYRVPFSVAVEMIAMCMMEGLMFIKRVRKAIDALENPKKH
ncbi:hypothetical protein CANARDRAFT_20414 [[Candida] arabinofermentans NRRL YB-2248]|uniref:DUF2470 domain-containing protein n=1 Tax=[Candida] arabinofermentans NRRL YB-2248 TaxID=983967 RepID=A0A1E4T7D6_9ASCO|nr:hypothetical protein CANARDRAFT_20414 [[Candida] arabinofermentans NRRL YB-2248]